MSVSAAGGAEVETLDLQSRTLYSNTLQPLGVIFVAYDNSSSIFYFKK